MPVTDPAGSALLTDLYELTMALGYWREDRAEQEAAFHLYFRTAPFRGGYTIACGLEPALVYLEGLRFTAGDLAYLGTLRGVDDLPLFPEEFLDTLGSIRLTLDVDMVAEGTVVFPNEPLVRVRGPLLQAQLVETALLTHIGFPTLVATKAARMCLAADGGEVLEFGLRRAQGPDGGLSASRAAFVRRMLVHVERAGRAAVRHPGRGDARAQLGDGLRRRAGRLHRLRRGDAEQRRVPGGHVRHPRRR